MTVNRNQPGEKLVRLYGELSKEGVQHCESEIWTAPELKTRNDGTGWLECSIPNTDLDYFTEFFIGMGRKATVKRPHELLDLKRKRLTELSDVYR
ncbi:WYL domain-containing protein [Fictibacillus sp. NRS-1165]|uniref:WYL domain-containing protein n=1 Tax=Fictibacillus sp. NRS-1165 TaxID=3144463 RepID=UPI003D214F5D